VIDSSTTLITAILLFVSILSAFTPKNKVETFKRFVGFFVFPLILFALTLILEVLISSAPKINWIKNIVEKIPWVSLSSNFCFIFGVFFLILLGVLNTSFYLNNLSDDYKKQEEIKTIREEIKKGNTKVCPNCGETVNKIAKVCHYCGHRFKSKKKTT